jgi:hyperosmotically inducible periplasmic protein
MYTRCSVIQVLLIVGMTVAVIPSLTYGQSRGTGTEGADSSYHSGSAATGHYGTSGSTETSRNEMQNSPATLTTGEDHEMSQRIRQALRADAGLAPYAEGIYIGANEGQVTLRGPVKTEKDKADISVVAQNVAGAREINNQLQVAPNLGGTTGGSVNPQ